MPATIAAQTGMASHPRIDHSMPARSSVDGDSAVSLAVLARLEHAYEFLSKTIQFAGIMEAAGIVPAQDSHRLRRGRWPSPAASTSLCGEKRIPRGIASPS